MACAQLGFWPSPALPRLTLLNVGGSPHLNKAYPTALYSQGRMRRALHAGPGTHLVREWWLELADIQGADQRDAVRGSPVLVPRVFARLPREAATQLHHGERWSLSCPEVDTGY